MCDGVGERRGVRDVVEPEGHGGVLHDVAGVDDVGARGRDLDLDLVAGPRDLGAEAHLGQQPGERLGRLAVGRNAR